MIKNKVVVSSIKSTSKREMRKNKEETYED